MQLRYASCFPFGGNELQPVPGLSHRAQARLSTRYGEIGTAFRISLRSRGLRVPAHPKSRRAGLPGPALASYLIAALADRTLAGASHAAAGVRRPRPAAQRVSAPAATAPGRVRIAAGLCQIAMEAGQDREQEARSQESAAR